MPLLAIFAGFQAIAGDLGRMDTGKTHYLQTDPRWAGLRLYDPSICDALEGLTDELHANERGQPHATQARAALTDFVRAVRKTIRDPAKNQPQAEGALFNYGCTVCSMATMLNQLGIKIKKQNANPANVLHALQDEQVMTLTGYAFEPSVDPVSVITNGRVRMSGYEDHGEEGTTPGRSAILRSNLTSRNTAALITVVGHEWHGGGDHAHVVLVTGKRSKGDWLVFDPSVSEPIQLRKSYKRIYLVRQYRRYK